MVFFRKFVVLSTFFFIFSRGKPAVIELLLNDGLRYHLAAGLDDQRVTPDYASRRLQA